MYGHMEKAEKVLCSLLERHREKYVPPTFLVWLYTAMKKIDEAYEWLEKGVQDHDPWLCFYGIHPDFLHARDQRFDHLIKEKGLVV